MKEMVYSAFSKIDKYKRDNKGVPTEKIKCHNGFAYIGYGLSYKPTWSDHIVYVDINDKIGIIAGKAWTTEEISREAESVIRQLQAIPEIVVACPGIKLERVNELSKTRRGEGGYGSTGK